MDFIDWFSGIGGVRVGLESAGHRCVWSCEIEDLARSVYKTRFGDEPEAKDILDVKASDIPSATMWCAGFPCVDVSTSGRRVGLSGSKSGLVWKLLELVEGARRRPEFLLLENVVGLLSAKRGKSFHDLISAIRKLGYSGSWRTLDAINFGVPARRRRVFILAWLSNARNAEILLEPGGVVLSKADDMNWARSGAWDKKLTLSSKAPDHPLDGRVDSKLGDVLLRGPFDENCILSQVACRGIVSRAKKRKRDIPEPLFTALVDTADGRKPKKWAHENPWGPGEPYVAQCHGNNVGPLGTLRAGSGTVPGGVPFLAHEGRARRFVPMEAERLMGFDDNHTLVEGATDSRRFQLCGNSVAIPVLAWIGTRLANSSAALKQKRPLTETEKAIRRVLGT